MWPLFKVANLLFMLVTSSVWFGFLVPGNLLTLLLSIFISICFAVSPYKVQFTPRLYYILVLILCYGLYGMYIINFNYGILLIISYLPALYLFVLDKPHQQDMLWFLTKWMAIILGVSMVWYLLSNFVPLPHFKFNPPALAFYKSFDNYIFFVTTEQYTGNMLSVMRFSGPFLEPGHQSTISALFLFANRYRFRENPYLWVLLIGVLISFSLAGYVCLAIGVLFLVVRNVGTLLAIAALLGTGYVVTTEVWDGGRNPVNILILKRLTYDEKKGIEGNNRTTMQTDFYFRDCVRNGKIWLGTRTLKVERNVMGAGYKIFMLHFGVIGTIFVFLLYLSFIPPKANKRYAYSFLIFMALIFLQRAYPTWFTWLASYILGIGVMRGERLFPPKMKRSERKALKAQRKLERKLASKGKRLKQMRDDGRRLYVSGGSNED